MVGLNIRLSGSGLKLDISGGFLLTKKKLIADCQEAGRETKLTFCGQCNPYRNIHREDLQQDVYLPVDGHSPGGFPPPPDHRELEF